ncbi:MAG TPA: VOC family protein [Patescibacteria group bacterium]|nr:VOC family protein [Patescibacteria group bacterium]
MNEHNPKGHIVLTVKDLVKSKTWYKKVFSFFNFELAFEDEEKMYFGIDSFPLYLAIFQGHKEFSNDTFNRYRIGLHHLAISTDSKEKVDRFYKHLLENKVIVTEPPQNYPDYGDEIYYAVFFTDPDGLRLEVFFEKN